MGEDPCKKEHEELFEVSQDWQQAVFSRERFIVTEFVVVRSQEETEEMIKTLDKVEKATKRYKEALSSWDDSLCKHGR